MSPTILIVDDEPIALKSLSDILRLEGYSVESAQNGQEAITYIRNRYVGLMIVDLRMPGIGGLEVVRIANEVSPDTEVILLTAYGTTESAVEALRLRIHDYLLKPASPAQILASVRMGLSRRGDKLRSKEGYASETLPDERVATVKLNDDTVIDLSRRLIKHGKKETHLTPAEGRLLRIFIENVGRVFSHRELVLLVQGYETAQHEAPEILRPLVSRLRQKIREVPALKGTVVSVRGTGYVFEYKTGEEQS
ncbi:MAG: response regulator transcription factor [Anaerolineae bacterium]|jgi:DNA-binding response OmpR family regulator|nr:response regulator transcription factor [Anaerolineae bacterium]MBT4311460.1 response regulator transcription factor [Anaerolineae bacterium]MBT4458640.1 response regulator transcription factor [Anaerolineae bacterium]MBT6324209.1 response regulator transcription factor [Anaerolineae bacterium]MBT6814694.1 response regulator transcription factor [Anaerolineae bacterium]